MNRRSYIKTAFVAAAGLFVGAPLVKEVITKPSLKPVFSSELLTQQLLSSKLMLAGDFDGDTLNYSLCKLKGTIHINRNPSLTLGGHTTCLRKKY